MIVEDQFIRDFKDMENKHYEDQKIIENMVKALAAAKGLSIKEAEKLLK